MAYAWQPREEQREYVKGGMGSGRELEFSSLGLTARPFTIRDKETAMKTTAAIFMELVDG